jgi:hypothetical protein
VGYRTERLADQNRILPAALASVFVSLTYPIFARALDGGSNNSKTRRDPHRGHFRRLSSRVSRNPAPRVQTNVCRSS